MVRYISELAFAPLPDENKKLAIINDETPFVSDIKALSDFESGDFGKGNDVVCTKCLVNNTCVGHIKYIKIKPIANPLYIRTICQLLTLYCPDCGNFSCNITSDIPLDSVHKIPLSCMCTGSNHRFHVEIIHESATFVYSLRGKKRDYQISMDEAYKRVKDINEEMYNRIGFKDMQMGEYSDVHITIPCSPLGLFLTAIPVIPNSLRPSFTASKKKEYDYMTHVYYKIYTLSNQNPIDEDSRDTKKKPRQTRIKKTNDSLAIIYNLYRTIMMPLDVDTLARIFKSAGMGNINSSNVRSLGKQLSGKDGLFRNYILGRRIDQCGRAVISPNNLLDIDQVGIPESLAKNIDVFHYINNLLCRRRLTDGDIVIFNRYPTLQRMNMFAKFVKIIPESTGIRTLQLNTANTPAYNADFDGDEMNFFLLNDNHSIAEALILMNPVRNILSPQNSRPIIHPVQDCITGVYVMTNDNDINRATIIECYEMFANHSESLEIFETNYKLKGGKMSGQMMFSFVLPKSFNFKVKDVEIVQGYLIKGRITKDILSGQTINIISLLQYTHGMNAAASFMERLQRLVDRYIRDIGLSVSYSDSNISSNSVEYNEISKLKEQIRDINSLDVDEIGILDNLSALTNRIGVVAMSNVSDDNNIKTSILSGAKGNNTNFTQMIGAVGQQITRGARMKPTIRHNRTLPHYDFSENSVESRGYIINSLSSGLEPEEYIHHTQQARDGLIASATKTADSGFMQRKISKYNENIIVSDDNITKRLGVTIQTQHGLDNLKQQNTSFLEVITSPIWLRQYADCVIDRYNKTSNIR